MGIICPLLISISQKEDSINKQHFVIIQTSTSWSKAPPGKSVTMALTWSSKSEALVTEGNGNSTSMVEIYVTMFNTFWWLTICSCNLKRNNTSWFNRAIFLLSVIWIVVIYGAVAGCTDSQFLMTTPYSSQLKIVLRKAIVCFVLMLTAR